MAIVSRLELFTLEELDRECVNAEQAIRQKASAALEDHLLQLFQSKHPSYAELRDYPGLAKLIEVLRYD